MNRNRSAGNMQALSASRCPHCKVTLFVTRPQLIAAGGEIRCGVCLQTFDANQHHVELPPSPPTTAEPGQDTASHAELGGPEQTAANTGEGGKIVLLEQGDTGEKTGASPSITAENIDADGDITPITPAPTSPTPVDQRYESNLDKPDSHFEPADEHAFFGREVLEEDTQPAKAEAARAPAPAFNLPLDALSDEWLSAGQPTPARTFATTGKRWAMLALISIGLALLLVQVSHQTSAQLSLNPKYRVVILRLCKVLGCPIATYRDIKSIHSDRLVIQQHPRHPDVLTADLVLSNRASFAQPFPAFELRFDDLNGNNIARRTFVPKEYLRGALAEAEVMAAQKSYRIALELLDPGPKATSFSVSVTE